MGFKPVEIVGLDMSRIPKVVTTPDLVSVFEAIEDAGVEEGRAIGGVAHIEGGAGRHQRDFKGFDGRERHTGVGPPARGERMGPEATIWREARKGWLVVQPVRTLATVSMRALRPRPPGPSPSTLGEGRPDPEGRDRVFQTCETQHRESRRG